MQVSAMPSTRMLTASRERAKPASSISKPTCMQKTRKAAINTHMVLMALISGVASRPGAAACTMPGTTVVMAATMMPMPSSLPAMRMATLRRSRGLRKFL
jgi:hypothetical protein